MCSRVAWEGREARAQCVQLYVAIRTCPVLSRGRGRRKALFEGKQEVILTTLKPAGEMAIKHHLQRSCCCASDKRNQTERWRGSSKAGVAAVELRFGRTESRALLALKLGRK